MKQPERNPNYAALLLALLFSVFRADAVAAAQRPGAQSVPQGKLLDTRVPEFELHDESLIDGLWKLARGPAPFAFGFEKVLKIRLTDPDIPDPRFSLQLKSKTIREVLDSLCQADPRFTWSMDGATVNVFPRAITSNPSYLLNRQLRRFDLKNATDVQDGLLAIVHQLPPPVEQIANAQAGGSDTYPPKPWTVTYHNLTVRQVINRLAVHGGPCGIWIFGGSEDFRAFGFFNTYLRCFSQSSLETRESVELSAKDPQPPPTSNAKPRR